MSKRCFICGEPATTNINGQWFCDEHAEFLGRPKQQGPNPITLIESLAFFGVASLGLAFTGLGVLLWMA